MRNVIKLLFCLLAIGCGGGDDAPSPPQSALLEFPLQNSECTAGVDVNGTTTSSLEFRWQASNNTDTYELRATNLNTNTTQSANTQTTAATLILEKGIPYSWNITSRNSGTSETAISETWLFYNAGSQTTYAPFPAEVISPRSGASVPIGENGEVILEWSGSDVDNDIESYEVYFSASSPPEVLVGSPSAGTTSFSVDVAPDAIYYWRIITRDSEGNTSDTGIFEFRVI
ncbi:MAG: hypothetical protein AAFO99_11860 [Bacteroidota bacterium]